MSSADLTIERPPPELLRENKRMLDKAVRDLDRERAGLQSQEKKLIVEIKKMAKENQMVILLPRFQMRTHCEGTPRYMPLKLVTIFYVTPNGDVSEVQLAFLKP